MWLSLQLRQRTDAAGVKLQRSSGGEQVLVRRILLLVAILVVGTFGLVAATANSRPAVAAPLFGDPAQLSYEPAAGAADLNPTATVAVSVVHGTFDKVELVAADGKTVSGALNDSRTRWTSSGPMSYATTYTWRGNATGEDGRAVPLDAAFSTVAPARQLRGLINIGDGRIVGVAAPIQIQFDGHVTDRAAAQRAMSVTTSVPVEGSWGWLPDEGGGSRVHWRPKAYWPANTKVTVAAKLFGVSYGDGTFGADDITSSFQVGPAQIVKADVNSHRMIVLRDGVQIADYPASYGLDSDPNRNTRSGIHVVTERFTDKHMVSQQYGYDVMEKWAVRMSNNGEFIHANPVTAGVQGNTNVSHGCVNLSLDNAKAYYDSVHYGDPVEVTGSGVMLSARDGDIWDWTLSWAQWQRLTAL